MNTAVQKLAARYLSESEKAPQEVAGISKDARVKTAGEVIFRKDLSGDANQWAYATPGPSDRTLGDFNYNPMNAKPLAKTLRSTLASLGHILSAYNVFAKVKSARVSPDGSLGGKGYIQKIPDMRKQYMNAVEAMSALSDTLYDEVNAPHWSVLSRQESPEEKQEVAEILADAEEIRENPEEWAEAQIEEEFEDSPGSSESKKASGLASRWIEETK